MMSYGYPHDETDTSICQPRKYANVPWWLESDISAITWNISIVGKSSIFMANVHGYVKNCHRVAIIMYNVYTQYRSILMAILYIYIIYIAIMVGFSSKSRHCQWLFGDIFV